MTRVWGVAYTEYLSDPRVRRESEALAERGDEVTVLCLAERDRPLHEDVRGVSLVRLPLRRYRGAGADSYLRGYGEFFVRALSWMAARRPADVVHMHTIPDALVFAALIPRLRGSRVVLDVHDLTPDLFALKFGQRSAIARTLRIVERASFAFANAVITVHEPYRKLVCARGAAGHRSYVVMNVADNRLFADVSRTDPAAAHSRSGVRVVYHGMLTQRYGVDVLIRAFAEARRAVPRLRLSLWGGGDYRLPAQSLAAELSLDGSVEWSPGFVPVDQLLPVLAAADIGVVPNRRNAFTDNILPTKLMEYAALGLPTIVSRTEVVQTYFDEDMVRYVTPGDVSQLGQALADLALDVAERERLGRSIQRFTREHTWARNKQELFRAIDGRPPSPTTGKG